MPLSSVLGAQSLVRPGVCTSSTRPASPFEGQVIYETDTDLVQVYNGSGWKALGRMVPSASGSILQLLTATVATSQTSSSSTYADITSMTLTVTPTSANSKIHVSYMTVGEKTSGNANNSLGIRLLRDSTTIATWTNCLFTGTALRLVGAVHCHYVDSPNTTSATTYKFQFANSQVAAAQVEVQQANSPGTITLMEIAG